LLFVGVSLRVVLRRRAIAPVRLVLEAGGFIIRRSMLSVDVSFQLGVQSHVKQLAGDFSVQLQFITFEYSEFPQNIRAKLRAERVPAAADCCLVLAQVQLQKKHSAHCSVGRVMRRAIERTLTCHAQWCCNGWAKCRSRRGTSPRIPQAPSSKQGLVQEGRTARASSLART